jgi:two-component system LytT family sensor kinase
MSQSDLATLVHAAGFVTGIALYAMLGVMVLRERATDRPAAGDRIPLATAVLGVLWNVGALVLYGPRDLGVAHAFRAGPLLAMGTVAFTALGFLPAVVVHAALQGGKQRQQRLLTSVAYLVSACAAGAQVWGAFADGIVPYRPALRLLAVGYAALLLLVVLRLRGQPGARAALAAAALASFAMMVLHLSHHTADNQAVLTELPGHHASLLLALVILWQDFRFGLADLFLKRVLAVVVLVSAALAAFLVVSPYLAPLWARDIGDPRATGILLTLWIGTALSYPVIRRAIDAFVDHFVLRRVDYQEFRSGLISEVAALDTPAAVLDAACEALRPALSADQVTWQLDEGDRAGSGPSWSTTKQQLVCVPVRTAEAPWYVITVSALRAGRRLMSADLRFLDDVSVDLARRVDAIRAAHERYEREAREQEAMQLATTAELRALRAQLNPHFLFNALTTIGHLLQEAPDRALATLLQLTGLLRTVLRPSMSDFVPLSEEMEIVEAYLAIERARFEDRVRVVLDVPEEVRQTRLPPLLLQPLVENAIKHGISPVRAGGSVTVWARTEVALDGERLRVTVSDDGVGITVADLARRRVAGLGLSNVERRLACVYGSAATFAFESTPGVGTTVEITLPVRGRRRFDEVAPPEHLGVAAPPARERAVTGR